MSRPYLTPLIAGLTTFLLLGPAQAETRAADVEAAAARYLEQHYRQQFPNAEIRLHLNPVSTALQLPDCSSPLSVEPPRGSGSRLTTRVSCAGPRNWGLFVTARVEVLRDVVVSRRPLGRGEIIDNRDISIRQQDISDNSRGYYTRPEDVIGRSASRNIANGSLLNAGMLTEPVLIHRGDSLIIEVKTGSLRIRAQGTALEDGEKGEQIRVRNDRSGEEIRARIVARGLVHPAGR
ncbi:flagella basal body P-ring formation protein FlgA [Marinobacterium nitratireducens]|uniref:Flagella basal body P-ring formation protein FlgA n=1 Tax=Marinobacterium nitratireducens TaxID=518897 RepID=A0A917ZKN4_9GAMM|nr:flagellar basal body P-ring formation chaperone FlgA [Marinobacterium nitratireducens]GGO84885.1 flagella basal body P-ring formation protein FlgA [Marinobacterium nitratireducens]